MTIRSIPRKQPSFSVPTAETFVDRTAVFRAKVSRKERDVRNVKLAKTLRSLRINFARLA